MPVKFENAENLLWIFKYLHFNGKTYSPDSLRNSTTLNTLLHSYLD